MFKCLLLVLIFASADTLAQESKPQLLIEAESLGTLAGVAAECGLEKPLEKYEYMAVRIIMNKSGSLAEENHYLKAFARSRMSAQQRQKTAPAMGCDAFAKRFEAQEIMKFTAYPDGSIRMTDGKWLLPRGQKNPPKIKE